MLWGGKETYLLQALRHGSELEVWVLLLEQVVACGLLELSVRLCRQSNAHIAHDRYQNNKAGRGGGDRGSISAEHANTTAAVVIC